jgi:hypothetical protein
MSTDFDDSIAWLTGQHQEQDPWHPSDLPVCGESDKPVATVNGGGPNDLFMPGLQNDADFRNWVTAQPRPLEPPSVPKQAGGLCREPGQYGGVFIAPQQPQQAPDPHDKLQGEIEEMKRQNQELFDRFNH